MFALACGKANREDGTRGQERTAGPKQHKPRGERGDWRARNLEAFTMPEFSDKAPQIRMESRAAVPRKSVATVAWDLLARQRPAMYSNDLQDHGAGGGTYFRRAFVADF
jgi:hypothetical protein